ncbi:MAG: phospholipid/cholesterol/gamma-HCH transport system substrate-binding protein [Solirubrobacterales bacterium]|jgi:ABC-type transporter Mla subunit MlaD|nr:phospholipid/cholesterol/gamma-HCH transport system substrate-binding protein [Solirubrobacterales bacterium]
MQKQAPSIGRILIAVGFTLSCFGLILFLWIAFGGPIPLKPESYRVTAYFPEATQLAQESDVRIGGVSVGKVKEISLAPPDERVNGKDTTEAVIEIEPEFAPISTDARAILRQKTLLGETYVELTSGTEPDANAAPVSLGTAANVSDAQASSIKSIPEGGSLGVSRTEEATQIDEIFNALDEETRTAFQRWQANAAIAIDGRGVDLNDSFGNLGPFLTDASQIVDVLARQKEALKGIVRDTGRTFAALTERGQELAGVVRGSDNTFDALASEDQALAQTFQILPTFQRESRLTLERLDQFQVNAHPLINELIPVAHDLSPTLRSVRELSPHLRNLFVDLRDLEDASVKGLPALRDFLSGLTPVLNSLDPFLANLNPVIRYLEFQRKSITDFLVGPAAALSGSYEPVAGDPAPRRGLRQLGYTGAETLGIFPSRLATNRGNGYLEPGVLNGYTSAKNGIFPNFDCKNTDYGPGGNDPDEQEIRTGQSVPGINNGNPPGTTPQQFAPCFIAGDFANQNDFQAAQAGSYGDGRFPELFSDP